MIRLALSRSPSLSLFLSQILKRFQLSGWAVLGSYIILIQVWHLYFLLLFFFKENFFNFKDKACDGKQINAINLVGDCADKSAAAVVITLARH